MRFRIEHHISSIIKIIQITDTTLTEDIVPDAQKRWTALFWCVELARSHFARRHLYRQLTSNILLIKMRNLWNRSCWAFPPWSTSIKSWLAIGGQPTASETDAAVRDNEEWTSGLESQHTHFRSQMDVIACQISLEGLPADRPPSFACTRAASTRRADAFLKGATKTKLSHAQCLSALTIET